MKRPNTEDYRPMCVGVDDYIEDLEKYCTYLENQNKQLRIGVVSQQRERLAKYTKWQNEVNYGCDELMYADIDKFLNG